MQFAPRDTLVRYEPLRYRRTGPGEALDGKPKFDVTTFNPEYFERLRRRVEMADERGGQSTEWHYHMIDYIHEYEATKPKQHPVGMTGGGTNEELRESPAEWMSPNDEVYDNGAYLENLTPASGEIIVVIDTDHIAPYGRDPKWPWMSLLRGKHFIVMDVYKDYRTGSAKQPVASYVPIRRAMGRVRRFAERVNLAEMIPDTTTSSTGYALVGEGEEYLIYQPGDNDFSVDLAAGEYQFEWYDTGTGRTLKADTLTAEGGRHSFELPPFEENLVLYLKRTARR